MPNQDCTEESVKVVATRNRLDFSYRPVPESQIFASTYGGSIKKLLDTLNNAKGWRAAVPRCGVGPACEQPRD
jgi:hypothetical protein